MGSGGSKKKPPVNTNQSAGGDKGQTTPKADNSNTTGDSKGQTTPTSQPKADNSNTTGDSKGQTTPTSQPKADNSDATKLPPIKQEVSVPPSSPPAHTTGGRPLPPIKQDKAESQDPKGDNSQGGGEKSERSKEEQAVLKPDPDSKTGEDSSPVEKSEKVESKTGEDNSPAEKSEKVERETEEKKGSDSKERNQQENIENKGETEASTNKQDSVKMPEIEDRVIPPEPEDQRNFDDALSSACLLIKPDSLLKNLNVQNVTKLLLQRSLPSNFKLHDLLTKLTHVQELDLSYNNMGPQAFRSVCLAMCNNTTILSLNLSDNKTDTDTSECIGQMLRMNQTLAYLDISNNNLGIDYFSKCVGPALKTNTSIQTLRAKSLGMRDLRVLMEGLTENTSLTEIDFSMNSFSHPAGVTEGFANILKRDDCGLRSMALGNCELNEASIEILRDGLQNNTSMTELNLNGNAFGSLKTLLKVVVTAASHPSITNLSVDNVQIQDTTCTTDDAASCVRPDVISNLQFLSLSSSKINDTFISSIATLLKGRQLPLIDIDLSANDELTPGCLKFVADMTSTDGSPSVLRKLKYSLMKNTNGLTDQLTNGQFPSLHYLNVRKSKLTDIHLLPDLYKVQGSLTTLILDGQKIANTDVMETLLASSTGGSLTTLSVGACSLSATDIAPLCQALRKGLKLHMLKVSSNRLEDKGVTDLVEAVLSNKTHPLAVLDVSSNTMTDQGALSLAKLFTTKSHTSQLHSLNVSSNDLGKVGLVTLVSVIGGKSPLRTLYLQNQTRGVDEGDMDEVFKTLAKSLGFKVEMKDEEIVQSCSDRPNLPEGLVVKLSPLGGSPGKLGCNLDSPRIQTDYAKEKLPNLSFADSQVISAFLKGTGSDVCVWSGEEWKMITGSNKPTTDTPSWLQVASSRDLLVYLCNLPGNTTRQKVEALLEMEADCTLEEVCLMKDPVTRSINGVGWALLGDKESVTKALDFFHAGMATIFGQAFLISPVKVKVDDEANTESQAKAREDQEERLKQQRQDDRDHRRLIQRTTDETWKRHAYRLAHPAYADGRIW
ncbi:uncharacterized protein LOC110451468 [Mizuhopecten yessoensis]|uniref:Ribonuclease inhibitor n=1 Tax=Mizuhopecten yessoensis TaxID=6573 RepID=A0A210QLM1_MIZYE|nr:uncharacterized protein LOC110451468 [Mizuhopecten yessoensis]OWF49630.1 Ribonuclease inhibitor [Mizuhopecten yessoensis]